MVSMLSDLKWSESAGQLLSDGFYVQLEITHFLLIGCDQAPASPFYLAAYLATISFSIPRAYSFTFAAQSENLWP